MNTKQKISKSAMICYSVIVALFVTIRMLSSFEVLDFLGDVGSYVLNVIVQVGLLFTISVFMFAGLQKRKPKQVFSYYGFKKISWRSIIYSILIGIIVYILNVFLVTIINSILTSIGYSSSGGTTMTSYPFWLFLINLVVTAVLPGICEETVHRGMLLRGLSSLGINKAILISSFLFGLLHLNIEQCFYAIVIGIFLGYLTAFCGSIYPAMIIHFMNNGLSVFMSYSVFNNLGFEGMFNWINFNLENNPLIAILFVICLIVLLSILLCILVRALYRDTALRRISKLQEAVFTEVMRTSYINEVKEMTENSSEGEGPQENPEQDREKLKALIHEQAIKTGATDIIDYENEENEGGKRDVVTTILITACFVLTTAVTIFTLIWGIL